MSTGERISHAKATAIAAKLQELLSPACDRIEVVGSLRRCKPDVGDIEFALLPKFDDPLADLFGTPVPDAVPTYSALDRVIADMIEQRYLSPGGSNGARRKRFVLTGRSRYPGFGIELYIAASRDNFGNVMLIRTGPDDFSRPCVTQWSKGGLLPDYLFHRAGFLYYRGPHSRTEQVQKTPDEESYFRFMKMPFVPPADRTAETVALLRAGRYTGQE